MIYNKTGEITLMSTNKKSEVVLKALKDAGIDLLEVEADLLYTKYYIIGENPYLFDDIVDFSEPLNNEKEEN